MHENKLLIFFLLYFSINSLEVYVDSTSIQFPEGSKLSPFLDLNSAFLKISQNEAFLLILKNQLQINPLEIVSLNGILRFVSQYYLYF